MGGGALLTNRRKSWTTSDESALITFADPIAPFISRIVLYMPTLFFPIYTSDPAYSGVCRLNFFFIEQFLHKNWQLITIKMHMDFYLYRDVLCMQFTFTINICIEQTKTVDFLTDLIIFLPDAL